LAIWLRYSAAVDSSSSSPTQRLSINVPSGAGDITPTAAYPLHAAPDTPTQGATEEEQQNPLSSLLFGQPPPPPGHCESCTCTITSSSYTQSMPLPRAPHTAIPEEDLDHDISPWQVAFLSAALGVLLGCAPTLLDDPGPNDLHKCSVVRRSVFICSHIQSSQPFYSLGYHCQNPRGVCPMTSVLSSFSTFTWLEWQECIMAYLGAVSESLDDTTLGAFHYLLQVLVSPGSTPPPSSEYLAYVAAALVPSEDVSAQAPVSHNPPAQAPASHNPPVQVPVSHNAPAQAPASHNPPVQVPVSHNAPAQAPASHNPPVQVPVSHNAPAQAPASHNPPVQAPVGHNTPAQPSVGPNAPTQPSVGPNAPAQVPASHNPTAQPSAGPNAPTQPSAGPNAPAQPSVGPNAPTQPSVGHNTPAQVPASHNPPAQPSAGPSAPTQPSVGPNAPAQPSVGPDAPAQPSVGPDATTQPSAGPSLPYDTPPMSPNLIVGNAPLPRPNPPSSSVGTLYSVEL
jgi:hypothetical protein